MYLVIPMAGAGKRFAEAGYSNPKPMISVLGKPMIQRVVENLDLPNAEHVFIVQQEHRVRYQIDEVLSKICQKPCKIIETENLLPGALLSVLKAERILEVDQELIIANSDQLVVSRPKEFVNQLRKESADGGIMTFKASGNKWSYAILDKQGYVKRVAEKEEISDNATIGVYYWRSSAYFVESAHKLIEKGVTTNGEFYVSPVFNEAISAGKKVLAIESSRHVSLGTPELLEAFVNQHR